MSLQVTRAGELAPVRNKHARSIGIWVRALLLTVGATISASCAPRLRPLAGAPTVARIPNTELPPIHRQIVFDWELVDRDVTGRGEGVARVAGPDSARLDLFLGGGFGSGAAILIADSLRIPGSGLPRRFIPPPPLLWAALGRVALPALSDTTARVDGELLRVDIGRPVGWRLTFHRDSLVRLERIHDGRIAEWVERGDNVIHYRSEEARRALTLTIKRAQEVPPFDASIWGPF